MPPRITPAQVEQQPHSSAWSLLQLSPREAGARFESEYRAHVAAGELDAACLAWCGAVASRFQVRDFAIPSALLEGWVYARDAFERLRDATRTHVAVCAYAFSHLVGRGAEECTHWRRIAVDCVDRAGADDLWLALGVAVASDVLWRGAPIADFVAIARKVDEVALRRRKDQSAAAWMAARLHCLLLFAGPKSEFPAGAIQEAIRLAMEQGEEDDMALASAVLVRDLTRNRLDEARTYFQGSAMQVAQLPAYDAWLLSFYKTWFSDAARDYETAVLDATRGLAIAERCTVAHAVAWARFALARTLAAAGEARKVCHLLAEARQAARSLGNGPLAALCRLAAALYALRRRKARAGARLAYAGLRAIEDHGLFYPPLFSLQDLELLFRSTVVLDANAPAEVLRTFHGIDATARQAHVSACVQIRVLGAFSIRRGDAVLSWPRKPPRRPLELLKALVASGVEGAHVERLTNTLWPDLEGDKARKAFSTALYRLRGMLGEGALVLNAGRLRVAPESAWVDALAFECAMETGSPSREDLALYAGPLLSEDDDPWIVSARDRLAKMHRSAVCRLGEAMLSRGRWREALELFGSALQRDCLAEVFYQGALAACLAGGLRAEASALFERCRKELSEQLGLSPSSKTLGLYQSVIRNS